MSEPIEFAVLTKAGGPLTKRISLDRSDKVTSDGNACYMSRGRAKRVRIDGFDDLAALIEDLTSQQAITLGALHDDLPDEVRIVTKAALVAGVAANDAVARTATNFVYRPGRPALALFDYDMKGMPPGVTQQFTAAGGFWAALTSVLPALASTGHLLRLSTSAGLSRTDTGATFPGSGGLHGYVVLADGADAVRFLKAMHVRCWLSGYGWMNVGAAGQLLERSIIDRMVGAPERLVFEGPPVVDPPLHQDAAARRPTVVGGDILDTARACPPLSILEQQAFDRLRAQERQRLAPECAAKRAAWIAARKARLVASGMTAEAATSTLEKWTNGVLLASVELSFDDPDFAGTTVGDVLDDPASFVGETLADPIEGIEDGRGKAKVMWDGGIPFIHSFAHGHVNYKLRYDAAAMQARIAKAADPVAALVKLVGMADLSTVEIEALAHDAARRANVGVRAVKSMLKAAAAEQRKQQAAAARQRMLAGRTDPRPLQDQPALDAEWLPVLGALDEVASAVELVRRPRRDIDGTLTRERRMPIAQTHAFNTANEEGDDA
jgi:hypothetical protein